MRQAATRTRTAMHVNAPMNSYMLPHGTRSSASPRVRTASTCRTTPVHVRPNAIRSQKPDGQRLAGASSPFRPVGGLATKAAADAPVAAATWGGAIAGGPAAGNAD